MKRVSIFLVTVALIVGMVGCGGGLSYELTITSTAGGSVTDPGDGVFTYDEGTVVSMVATPDSRYRFVNWTGDVDTIADVSDTTTIITMNGDYSITANFEKILRVSWWRGEGDANDSWDDNDGVLMNGATFSTGRVGQAFQLDGLDDWVMIPSAPNLNFGTEDFTVCLWVNFAEPYWDQVLIEKYVETFYHVLQRDSRAGWTLTKLTGNVIRFAGPLEDESASILDARAIIIANRWHFAAVCRSGGTYRIYWDGILIGSTSRTDNLNLDSDTSLKIGHRGTTDDTPGSLDWRNFYLKGLVDEVQIYNYALNDADILSMFNNPSGVMMR